MFFDDAGDGGCWWWKRRFFGSVLRKVGVFLDGLMVDVGYTADVMWWEEFLFQKIKFERGSE